MASSSVRSRAGFFLGVSDMAKRKAKELDLPTLIERFGGEGKCHAYLEELRWPDGLACPRCKGAVISRLAKRRQFECDSCAYQFSVRVGTVLQDSKLPLWKWFLAVYMMCQSRKGLSANQLKRMVGVSYKTAWFLCHRIRAAMGGGINAPLSGIVEVDEPYVGGKVRGHGRGYRGNKSMVLGAIERGGEVRLRLETHADRKTLHDFILRVTEDETQAIFTDERPAYASIADADTRHETVNHRAEEWVRGEVHTNTVESVWSLLKRSIIGSYHHLSVKHLPAYLDELEWRFNKRGSEYLFRDTVIALCRSEVVTYEKLIG